MGVTGVLMVGGVGVATVTVGGGTTTPAPAEAPEAAPTDTVDVVTLVAPELAAPWVAPVAALLAIWAATDALAPTLAP